MNSKKCLIIVIVVFLCIVAGVCLYVVFNKNDDITANKVAKNEIDWSDEEKKDEDIKKQLSDLVEEYINDWCVDEKITDKTYKRLENDIEDIGIDEYEIKIEIKSVSSKMSSKSYWSSSDHVSEKDVYDVTETEEILEEIDENGEFELNEEDIITLTIIDNDKNDYREYMQEYCKENGLGDYVISAMHSTVLTNEK